MHILKFMIPNRIPLSRTSIAAFGDQAGRQASTSPTDVSHRADPPVDRLTDGKMLPLKVLIAEKIGQSGIRSIESLGSRFVSVQETDRKTPAFETELRSADVLIVRGETKVTAELMQQSPALSLVVRAGNGLDNIDCAFAREHGIQINNTPGANLNSTAEHALGLMFAASRNIASANHQIKNGNWDRHTATGIELHGKTLGIFGPGRIGTRLGEKCKALGMTVIAHEQAGEPNLPFGPYSVFTSKNEVLERSDVVSLHIPLMEETRHFIGPAELRLMKPEAILVNCARGGIVDEAALLDAIDAGALRGAAIDTFVDESPAEGSIGERLSRHPQVVATPHIGGQTVEALEGMGTEAAQIIGAYIEARMPTGAPSPFIGNPQP